MKLREAGVGSALPARVDGADLEGVPAVGEWRDGVRATSQALERAAVDAALERRAGLVRLSAKPGVASSVSRGRAGGDGGLRRGRCRP